MTITGEFITIILGIITLVGILLRSYDLITKNHQELKGQIGQVRETLEKKDLTLETLIDKQQLITSGLKERIDHHTVRLRAENKELEIRVRGIEGFLMKTTDFTARQETSQNN